MKILLAVDGSKHSGWSAEFLTRLPLAEKAEIHVITVVDPDAFVLPAEIVGLDPGYAKRIREETKKRLTQGAELTSRTARELRANFESVTAGVEQGHVADRILSVAKKSKTDLIVLGSHGLGRIKSLLLGSVSQRVVTHAHCSVAVVKKRPRAMKRFTLAIDGSENADRAAAFLYSQLDPKAMRGTVVYAWVPPISPHPFDLIQRSMDERFCDPLRKKGLNVKFRIETGDAAASIAEVAEVDRSDLVVVGSRGLSAIGRFFLGGVSHKVVMAAPTNVVVVRD